MAKQYRRYRVLREKNPMFGLFKKKTKLQVLEAKYKNKLKQAHALSTTSRAESDKKYVEAHEISIQIEALKKQSGH